MSGWGVNERQDPRTTVWVDVRVNKQTLQTQTQLRPDGDISE